MNYSDWENQYRIYGCCKNWGRENKVRMKLYEGQCIGNGVTK